MFTTKQVARMITIERRANISNMTLRYVRSDETIGFVSLSDLDMVATLLREMPECDLHNFSIGPMGVSIHTWDESGSEYLRAFGFDDGFFYKF